MKIKKSLNVWLFPIVLLLTLIFIALLVITIPQVTTLDIAIIKFLQKIFSFLSVNFSVNISKIFHLYWSVILLITSIYLFYKKDNWLLLLYSISIMTAKGFIEAIKNIIQRPRPPIELQPFSHPDTFSYPSGHSYSIMILLGLLIYIIVKHSKINIIKYALVTIFSLTIVLVGLSRLLLGVHYPTDVISGFLLGLIVIATIYTIDKQNNTL